MTAKLNDSAFRQITLVLVFFFLFRSLHYWRDGQTDRRTDNANDAAYKTHISVVITRWCYWVSTQDTAVFHGTCCPVAKTSAEQRNQSVID